MPPWFNSSSSCSVMRGLWPLQMSFGPIALSLMRQVSFHPAQGEKPMKIIEVGHFRLGSKRCGMFVCVSDRPKTNTGERCTQQSAGDFPAKSMFEPAQLRPRWSSFPFFLVEITTTAPGASQVRCDRFCSRASGSRSSELAQTRRERLAEAPGCCLC